MISRYGSFRSRLEAGKGAWNTSPSNETEHGRTGAISPPAADLSTTTHRSVRAAPKPLGSTRRPDSSGPASPAPPNSDQRVPDSSDVHGTKEALPTTTARTHAATNEPTTVITGGGGTESPSTCRFFHGLRRSRQTAPAPGRPCLYSCSDPRGLAKNAKRGPSSPGNRGGHRLQQASVSSLAPPELPPEPGSSPINKGEREELPVTGSKPINESRKRGEAAESTA
ncbi:hypothetical protein HPB47_019764 [Ixodes persulcatus]|uniref:Uncharacterized protein n=1 Tax=Ixodes persulcatus TaxID=34615 RepID=A0AC60QH71_IXOPE|nr:hypothetical protein HPB47_019764 [Ixodes persulcatus]